jgi:hypothetical protein
MENETSKIVVVVYKWSLFGGGLYEHLRINS